MTTADASTHIRLEPKANFLCASDRLGNSVGGFGGVLAYGLMQMDGVQGHEGWRWIFIWLVFELFSTQFPSHRQMQLMAANLAICDLA